MQQKHPLFDNAPQHAREGWTSSWLARELGVSRTTTARWYQDRLIPVEYVDKVAKVTGLTPGKIRPDLRDVYYDLYVKFWHPDEDGAA